MTFDDVAPALYRLTGREPETWTPIDEGAYSAAGRWVVRWAGGGSAFVKAEAEPDERYGVAVEHRVYSSVSVPCVPRLYAYGDGVLVIEDLSDARWGTPLTVADVTALRDALGVLADVPAPDGLRPLVADNRWRAFVADPAPLLATGLVDEPWLTEHLAVLSAAEDAADPTGDRLVHGDVWLQNWCRTDRGVVLVDWAGCHAANPMAMYAWGEAGVRAAAGPHGIVLPSGHAAWAAWIAGQAAYFLTEDSDDVRMRETERREGLAALRWACDELDLPHPPVRGLFADLGPWRP